jgi:hypothetical protein
MATLRKAPASPDVSKTFQDHKMASWHPLWFLDNSGPSGMLWAYPQEASRFFGMLSHLGDENLHGIHSDGIPGSSWGYDGAYQVMGLWYNGIYPLVNKHRPWKSPIFYSGN